MTCGTSSFIWHRTVDIDSDRCRITLTFVPDSEPCKVKAMSTDIDTYKIVRFYADDTPREVIETGLTLAEAQAHCDREDTHGDGWFDGYTAE